MINDYLLKLVFTLCLFMAGHHMVHKKYMLMLHMDMMALIALLLQIFM